MNRRAESGCPVTLLLLFACLAGRALAEPCPGISADTARRLFDRVKSELDLSAEAAGEAEAVLGVAVGLAIPSGRRS